MKINHTKEVWKWVVVYVKGKRISYEGYYTVSNFGRIRRVKTLVYKVNRGIRNGKRLWQTVIKEKGIIKPFITKVYPSLRLLTEETTSKLYFVHHLVLWTFKGECPEGMECCHKDDIPTNNFVGNLYWGTQNQNKSDAKKNGKLVIGERCSWSKMTDKKVRKIRMFYSTKLYSQTQLAKRFKVHLMTINHIIHRRTWKHVA